MRTEKHQEVHFHTIKLWKSLPQDVMEARSVKGVQKGIIQINGWESHQRLLNMTFWLGKSCTSDCQSQEEANRE